MYISMRNPLLVAIAVDVLHDKRPTRLAVHVGDLSHACLEYVFRVCILRQTRCRVGCPVASHLCKRIDGSVRITRHGPDNTLTRCVWSTATTAMLLRNNRCHCRCRRALRQPTASGHCKGWVDRWVHEPRHSQAITLTLYPRPIGRDWRYPLTGRWRGSRPLALGCLRRHGKVEVVAKNWRRREIFWRNGIGGVSSGLCRESVETLLQWIWQISWNSSL